MPGHGGNRTYGFWNTSPTQENIIIRLVARLSQQVRYSHDITILLQPCVVNLVTFLLYHDCIRLVKNNLVTSVIMPSSLLQVVNSLCHELVTTTGNKQCEHNLPTACEQICNNLFAETCYGPLRVYMRPRYGDCMLFFIFQCAQWKVTKN
jgi:hypothetical protein